MTVDPPVHDFQVSRGASTREIGRAQETRPSVVTAR